MDTSLVALGALIVISLAIAAVWHAILTSYALAIGASAFTVVIATYIAYPIYRGEAPSPLILGDAAILSAVIALAVGIPFKRRRAAKSERRL
jgi:ABC-type spermidine/putrescine transport system permease subunit II